MTEKHISNDEFLSRLGELFQSHHQKGHGSIFLTQKRMTFALESSKPTSSKPTDDPLWDLKMDDPLPVIVRATDGKNKDHRAEKIKLSTIVQPDDLDAFYTRYADICKAGMQSLRKRDRTKRKKTKAKKQKSG